MWQPRHQGGAHHCLSSVTRYWHLWGLTLCGGVNLVSESNPQVVKTTAAHMPPLFRAPGPTKA